MLLLDISLFLSFGLFVYFFYKHGWKKFMVYIDDYISKISEKFKDVDADHDLVANKLKEETEKVDNAQKQFSEMIENAHITAEQELLKMKEDYSKRLQSRHIANQHIIQRLHEGNKDKLLQIIINHVMKQAQVRLFNKKIDAARINDFKAYVNDEYQQHS